MNALVFLAVMLALLFAMSYFTKRRFGVLGLALCAGSLLSTSWAAALTPWVEAQGIVFVAPPLSAIVSALLILGPSVLLFFSGPTYSGQLQRIVGSVAYAALAFVFLLQPIATAFVFDDTGLQIYNTIHGNANLIIVGGVLLALVDILMTRHPHAKKSAHK